MPLIARGRRIGAPRCRTLAGRPRPPACPGGGRRQNYDNVAAQERAGARAYLGEAESDPFVAARLVHLCLLIRLRLRLRLRLCRRLAATPRCHNPKPSIIILLVRVVIVAGSHGSAGATAARCSFGRPRRPLNHPAPRHVAQCTRLISLRATMI